MKNKLFLILLFVGLQQLSFSQTFNEILKAVASDRQANATFGVCVSISGNYAVIGAHQDDLTGGLTDAGAAYVFERDANCDWIEVQKLTASDAAVGDAFGQDVYISGDYLIVGALSEDHSSFTDAGAAYIFERNVSGVWIEVQKITASDNQTSDRFGKSVSINGDYVVVGAYNEDHNVAGSVPLADAGSAYVFERNISGVWNQVQKIVASDRNTADWFGYAVAISENFLIVGAHAEDENATGGSTMSSAGSAYIFERNISGVWNQIQKIVAIDRAPNDKFGFSVAIDGNTAVIGAFEEDHGILTNVGAAYVFDRNIISGVWNQTIKLISSDGQTGDNFGVSVSIDDNYIVVGTKGGDTHPAFPAVPVMDAGSAYIYKKTGTWSQWQKLEAAIPEASAYFGWEVGISALDVLVGSFWNNTDATGANPLNDAGSAHFFEPPKVGASTPTISASPIIACGSGAPVVLNITSGNLNDATDWVWYQGSCGGTPIGTGTSINVFPSATTTYYVRGEGNCVSNGACGSITITLSGDYWHQTTENSVTLDTYNDAITDSDGNVYVVGSYIKATTLNGGGNPDINISSASTSTTLPNTFLAKYDPCGSLVWKAYSNTYTNNIGNGIALDENAGMVYITGNFNNSIRFPGACGGATAVLITSAGSNRGYVAQFDMTSGCANFVNPITLPGSNYVDCRAITVDESDHDIYIGGIIVTSSRYSSFITKYTPTTTSGLGNQLNPNIWNVIGLNTLAGDDKINDLDYNESTSTLYGIGDFNQAIQLNPGAITLTTLGNDAYICAYNDAGSSCTQTFLIAGGISGEMYGEGIATDETNDRLYVIGTFKGSASNPFNLLSYGIAAFPNFTNETAYMIGVDFTTTTAWSKNAYVTLSAGKTFGREVTCTNDQVFFIGDFSKNSITIQSLGSFPFFGSNSLSVENFHIFTASYSSTGSALNANVTKSGLATTADNHRAKSIVSDGYNHCFAVGQYYKKMGYYSGFPSSGTLVSSPTGPSAFVMRTIQSTGEYKISEDITEEAGSVITNGNLIVFPNPTNGLTTIAIENFDVENTNYKLVLYNAVGKLMQQINVTGNKIDVDLSAYENGIYLLSFSDGVTTSVVRISKTN